MSFGPCLCGDPYCPRCFRCFPGRVELAVGMRVILPACEGCPEQKATIVGLDLERDCVMVCVDPEDRLPDDPDGLGEVGPSDVIQMEDDHEP